MSDDSTGSLTGSTAESSYLDTWNLLENTGQYAQTPLGYLLPPESDTSSMALSGMVNSSSFVDDLRGTSHSGSYLANEIWYSVLQNGELGPTDDYGTVESLSSLGSTFAGNEQVSSLYPSAPPSPDEALVLESAESSEATTRSPTFKCPYVCGRTFRRKVDVDRHFREQHKCGHMDCQHMTFRTRDERDTHRASHVEQGIAYVCGSCDLGGSQKIFARKDRIKNHLTKKHKTRGEVAFQHHRCVESICQRGVEGGVFFASAADLERHQKSKHTQEQVSRSVTRTNPAEFGSSGRLRLTAAAVPTESAHQKSVIGTPIDVNSNAVMAIPRTTRRTHSDLSSTEQQMRQPLAVMLQDKMRILNRGTTESPTCHHSIEKSVSSMKLRTLCELYSSNKFLEVVAFLKGLNIQAVFIRSQSILKLRGNVDDGIMEGASNLLRTFVRYALEPVPFSPPDLPLCVPRSVAHAHSFTPSCPRISPLLPTRLEDREALATWTYILPVLRDLLAYSEFGDSYGMSLVRQEGDQGFEEPVIRILSSSPLTARERERVEKSLHKHYLQSNYTCLPIVWDIGMKVPLAGGFRGHQSFESREPLNVSGLHRQRYYERPGIGASIGMNHCPHVYATLGGYLSIGNRQYALTAMHLSDNSKACRTDNCSQVETSTLSRSVRSPAKTNLTEQARIVAKHIADLREGWHQLGVRTIEETSSSDEISLDPSMNGLTEYGRDMALSLRHYRRIKGDMSRREEELEFGVCEEECDPRPWKPRYPREKSPIWHHQLDWALIRVFPNRLGKNKLRYDKVVDAIPTVAQLEEEVNDSDAKYGHGPSCEGLRDFDFEETVFYVGAHSGYQEGKADLAHVDFFDDGRWTQEWTITPSSPTRLTYQDVGGDSGAWVMSKSGNQLLGLLWGYFDGRLLFTPIKEVIASIEETTGSHACVRIAPLDDSQDNISPLRISGRPGSLRLRAPQRALLPPWELHSTETLATSKPLVATLQHTANSHDMPLINRCLSNQSSAGRSSPTPSLSSSVLSRSEASSRETSPERTEPPDMDLLGSLKKLEFEAGLLPTKPQKIFGIHGDFPAPLWRTDFDMMV